jgi:hypothetical protein
MRSEIIYRAYDEDGNYTEVQTHPDNERGYVLVTEHYASGAKHSELSMTKEHAQWLSDVLSKLSC